MKSRMIALVLVAGCVLLGACAVITVNVYFPEKAAKEAYKSLDEMLLKNGGDKGTGGATGTPGETPPAGDTAPVPPKDQEVKPQSRVLQELPSLSLVSVAYAAENDAETLAVELSSMPEVLKAYDEMNQRLPRLQSLFDGGAVGLTNQGLVTVRDKTKVTPQDEALVSAENQSRKTVVGAMAKAIVKLNKQKLSKEAIDQVLGKAATTFAETKREKAKPGWWVQLANGRWVQK